MVRAVTPIPFVKARFFDRCGKPLAGGKVYTYEANTTTAKTTYKDPYGLTPNTNPIILDAAGEADIYLEGTYRIRIMDRNDVLINDVSKIGSWFSDNLQDTLDNISSAMDDALKPMLQNLDDAINAAAAAAAGANGWDANLVAYGETTQKQINDGLESVAQLANIQNPRNGMRVYVKDSLRNGEFAYNPNKASINNGGTIFNGWVRQYTGAVYLDWFCETDPATTDCSPYLTKALAAGIVINAGTGTFLFKTQVGLGGLGVPNYDGTVQYNWGDTVLKIIGTGQTTFLIDTKDTGKPVFTSAKQLTNPTSEEDIFTGKIEVSGINFIGVNKDLTVPNHWEMVEGSRNLHDRVFDLDRLYNTFVHHCNFTHLGRIFEAVKNKALFNKAYSQSTTITDCHYFHNNRIVYSTGTLINFTFKDNMCEKNYGGIYAKGTGTARINDNLFEGGGQFIHITGDTVATTIDGNYLEYNVQDDVLINKCQIFIGGNTNGALINGNSFTGLQSTVLQDDADYCDIKLPKPTLNATNQNLLNFESNKAIISGNYTDSRQLHTSGAAISTGNSSPNWITYGYVELPTISNYNSASARANHEAGYSFSSGEFSSTLTYEDYTQITRPTGGYKLRPLITIGSHPSGVGAGNVMIGVISVEHMLGDKGFNKVSAVAGRISANINFIAANGLPVSHAAIQFELAIFNTGKNLPSIDSFIDDAIVLKAGKPSILEGYGMLVGSDQGPTALTAQQFRSPESAKVTFLKTGRGRYAIYVNTYEGYGVPNIGVATRIESSLMWQGNVNQYGVSEQYASNVALIGYWW